MKTTIGVVLLGSFSFGPTFADGLTPMQTLGKSLFFDANLSANGVESCAFCHESAMGFSSPHGPINVAGAVIEGAIPGRFGNRKPPSMAYASESPVLHHIVDDGDVTFVGGAFLDGRATGSKLGNPTADQAQGPFLNALEMAMPHAACVVQRVMNPANPADYPVTLSDVWGADVPKIDFPADLAMKCKDPEAQIEFKDEETDEAIEDAFGKIAYAISAYEDSTEVDKFNSRYDKWVEGTGELTKDELAGLELFKDESKGNCAACHVLTPSTRGQKAVFTDWTFDNLGVPRNRDNPFYAEALANPAGKAYVDPGLGGYLETDPVYASFAAANMGRQQVPTLRNLTKGVTPATPKAYMHNGYFKTLGGVVHFYNTRDTLPRCNNEWATEVEAMAQNCWPKPEIAETMNKDELGNLKLSATEELQIVAFLRTLDDE
ncbi:MAG: cytochrome-c peroxidase [Cypionkella sp.]